MTGWFGYACWRCFSEWLPSLQTAGGYFAFGICLLFAILMFLLLFTATVSFLKMFFKPTTENKRNFIEAYIFMAMIFFFYSLVVLIVQELLWGQEAREQNVCYFKRLRIGLEFIFVWLMFVVTLAFCGEAAVYADKIKNSDDGDNFAKV